jgi:hypothetical protein
VPRKTPNRSAKISSKSTKWFFGLVFGRNRDHSRGLSVVFRIQIRREKNNEREKNRSSRGGFWTTWVNLCDIFKTWDNFFRTTTDTDTDTITTLYSSNRFVVLPITTSSGSKTSRKQSTSRAFRRTSSTRREWCFSTNARIREVRTARVSGLRPY